MTEKEFLFDDMGDQEEERDDFVDNICVDCPATTEACGMDIREVVVHCPIAKRKLQRYDEEHSA